MSNDKEWYEKLFTKRNVIVGIIALLALIVICRSVTILDPTEEAVLVSFGVADDQIVNSGVHLNAPFGQEYKVIDKTPIEYEKEIPLGEKALITSDQQSLGLSFKLTWKYKDNSAYTIATKYATKDSIYNLISGPCKQGFHNEIGKVDAATLVTTQDKIITNVIAYTNATIERLGIPIELLNLTIDNINWDPSYEKQVVHTMELKQQVIQAQQEADQAAALAQKQVKEAQARAEAAKLDAEAEVSKAKGEAESRKLKADATAYENQKIAQNQSVENAKWKHDEQMAYYEKWNGNLVPTYVPLTAAGGIVNLK